METPKSRIYSSGTGSCLSINEEMIDPGESFHLSSLRAIYIYIYFTGHKIGIEQLIWRLMAAMNGEITQEIREDAESLETSMEDKVRC